MNLLDIVMDFKTAFFPHIPYRTGRLANTGMGDLYSPYGVKSIGFDFCNRDGLEYGIILNEAPIINYNLNGRKGSYANRHFGYFDTFFSSYATSLALRLGGELIEGEI